ncbi:hypothetical protein AAFF_G00184440 [Aldrovandia affinis]|uniref:Uncharacterized protein n=1 Tax=Aldrovandia affinis TaxID=143900 RepID=A0AAD7RKI7_9TELE|nr:hypothetical protein AAFF_G00184440 [Aldrovandia affinis]
MKSYDNGSPQKARKYTLPRNGALFLEGSKAYLIEPQDCPQILDFNEESILSSQSCTDERKEGLLDLSISSPFEEAKCKGMSSGGEVVLQPQWHSIEAIQETYRDYMEEREVEEKVLQEQLRSSKEKNKQLILTVESLGTQLQDLEASKEILGREQRCQEAVLACLRKCFLLQSS